MGEFSFRNDLSNLMRDCDLQQLLDFIGHDYDFEADPHSVLDRAAHYRREEILLHALDHGGNPNGSGDFTTPLASVCGGGDVKLAKMLLKRGAEVDLKDKFGRTAMISAVYNMAAVELLLDAGASLDGAMEAAVDKLRIAFVKFLIEAGAPLDQVDSNGLTPLLRACSAGKKKGSEIALLLLQSGADATYVREEDGMFAIKLGYSGYGECSAQVFAELRARGAPEPEWGSQIVQLM